MSDLESRIAAVLADETVSSDVLGALVTEVEAAIVAGDAATVAAKERALDPALSPDPKAARAEMEDAEFCRDRLKTVLPRVQDRLERAQRFEAKAAWIRIYDELIPRRDALVEELQDLYTEFAPKLVDVLQRAAAMDRELKRAEMVKPVPQSGERPDGRELVRTEACARGYTDLTGGHLVTLMRDLLLPDWGDVTKRCWPPYSLALDQAEQALEHEAWRQQQAHMDQAAYQGWRQQQAQQAPAAPHATDGAKLDAHYKRREAAQLALARAR